MSGYVNGILLPQEHKNLGYINFNFNAQTDGEKIREVLKYEGYQFNQGQKKGIIVIPTIPGRTEGDMISKYNNIVEMEKAYLNHGSRKSGIITMSASEDRKKPIEVMTPQEWQDYKRRKKGEAFLRRKFARYPRMK